MDKREYLKVPATRAAALPQRVPLQSFVSPLKRALAAQVVDIFNDKSTGQNPVKRQPDGLFGPDSVAWRVHGDVTSMMVGGVAGLLLQMLHPAVLAGVWDHSKFRDDMHGRLRRTARFIALTTYSSRDEAEASIAHVKAIHDRITGVLPDGTPYAANDPKALAWVHATASISFLAAWIRYGEPNMSRSDKDRYFQEMAQVAMALGASPVPTSYVDAQSFMTTMRSVLRYDIRTRSVARLILSQSARSVFVAPLQAVMMQASIDLLPSWARQMHRLQAPILTRPLMRGGTLAIAEALRWAFR